MRIEKFPLLSPSLEELSATLQVALQANYGESKVEVAQCPDLREAPFRLATEGLCGDEKIADVGGQANLFPTPRRDQTWVMSELAQAMEMSDMKGSLIGAGAGPFHLIGQNCELCPNFTWKDGFENCENGTRYVEIDRDTNSPAVVRSSSLECGLMVNLFGSSGERGSVIKITARGRKGDEGSFTECIRKSLAAAYGNDRTISLGGVFIAKSAKVRYHIMPDFPPAEDLPFKDRSEVTRWLRFYEFDEPIVCMSILHSSDPEGKMDLRIEHSHGFSPEGAQCGGHYHHDIGGDDEAVEYEGYFNTAKMIYRIDRTLSS